MKVGIYFTVILAAAWGAYWWGATLSYSSLMGRWLEDRRTEGWAVDYRLETGGFPATFAASLSDLRLADPDTGLAWSAPRVDLRAAAWAPNRVEVVFPPVQVWASPFEKLTLKAAELRAGLALGLGGKLPLDSSTLLARDLTLVSSAGWQSTLAQAAWQSRPAPSQNDPSQNDPGQNAHALRAEATDLRLMREARALIDPRGLLPEVISALTLEGVFGFDAPWDLDALEVRRPQPTHIELTEISATWGQLELRLAGDLAIDSQGIAEGTLDVRAVNWRDWVALLQSSGALPADLGPFVMRALEVLAAASGRADTIDAPLTLSGGFIRFGPVPIGPAPRFVLR